MAEFLPNPKKEVIANFPIAKVKEAILELPKYTKSAVFNIQSDVMNFYRFDAQGKGLFNMGMYLEISLFEFGENKTEIRLEGRRKLGWIDNALELSETTNYLIGCITLLGKVLTGEAKPAS